MTGGLFLLPASKRRDFAWPRGLVYSGDFTGLLDGFSPIFCVGDVVSSYCARAGLGHVILVVDGKTRRSITTGRLQVEGFKVLKIRNPRGSLSHEAYTTYCRIARDPGRWLVEVEGEEDMTALAAIACTPPGGAVVYGVPGVGASIIRVNTGVSREAQARLLALRPAL